MRAYIVYFYVKSYKKNPESVYFQTQSKVTLYYMY